MKTVNFALPAGWTYSALRQFLQSELSEDRPGSPDADTYLSITDFDDNAVVYSEDWDGATYQIPYTIANSGSGSDVTWGTPVEVAQKITYVPVAEMAKERAESVPEQSAASFSSDLSIFAIGDALNVADDDWIVRSGVVFETGDYPDKAKALGLASLVFAPDDLKTMVETFAPIENRVSHVNGRSKTPTIFDDHMGRLESVWVDESGTKLHGAIRIPRFLDEFQKKERGGGPLQASLEIDPVTKRIVGNTLVPNPRVETSALMSACAAFSKQHAPEERETTVGKTEETQMTETPKEDVVTVNAAQFAKMQADNEANTRRIAEMARDVRTAKAETQTMALLRGGKFPAVSKPYLLALFTATLEDDDAAPKTINFSAGEQPVTGNRTDILEAALSTLPALLTREIVPGEERMMLAFTDEPADQKAIDEAVKSANEFKERQIAATAGRNGR